MWTSRVWKKVACVKRVDVRVNLRIVGAHLRARVRGAVVDDATIDEDSALWESFEKQFKAPRKKNLLFGLACALGVVVSFFLLPKSLLFVVVPSVFFLGAVYFLVQVIESQTIELQTLLRGWRGDARK